MQSPVCHATALENYRACRSLPHKPSSRLSAALAVCCLSAGPGNALVGTVLQNGNSGRLVDMQTGAVRSLPPIPADSAGHNSGYVGSRFSPDGRRIVTLARRNDLGFNRIFVMDNDGSHLQAVCDLYNTALTMNVFLSWTIDDYVYWSEGDSTINRVNLRTRQREVFMVCPIPPIRWASVSMDGTRAAAQGKPPGLDDPNIIYTFDLVAKTQQRLLPETTSTQCQPYISRDGRMVTRDYACHCIGNVVSFAGDTILHVINPPPGAGVDRFIFSSASANYIGYVDGVGGTQCLLELSTDSTYIPPGSGWANPPADFWPGPLPPPPPDSPWIALDSASLRFAGEEGGSAPPSQPVGVTNTGAGVLEVVSVSDDAPWLTVVVEGSAGNSQTLTNTVDLAGLSSGAYVATVTVSGGGATNIATYSVALSVGLVLMPPSDLTATALSDHAVRLAWTDNSGNEAGFVLERAAGSGSWALIGATTAGATTYGDSSGLTTGVMYHYRVRAFLGPDTSVCITEDSVSLQGTPAITLTQPSGGQQWAAGSTQHVRWTAMSVAEVSVAYSVDGGDNWHLISTGGAVTHSNPLWGDYPWVVPDSLCAGALVVVYDYNDRQICATSAPFAIVPGTETLGHGQPSVPVARTLAAGPFLHLGRAREFGYAVAQGQAGCVRIFRPDGSHVADVGLTSMPGYHRAVWDGTDGSGHHVGPGAYVAQHVRVR